MLTEEGGVNLADKADVIERVNDVVVLKDKDLIDAYVYAHNIRSIETIRTAYEAAKAGGMVPVSVSAMAKSDYDDKVGTDTKKEEVPVPAEEAAAAEGAEPAAESAEAAPAAEGEEAAKPAEGEDAVAPEDVKVDVSEDEL